MSDFILRDADNLQVATTEPDDNAYLVLVDPADDARTLRLPWSLLKTWFAPASVTPPAGPNDTPLEPNRIFVGTIGGVRGIWACDGERWMRAPVSEGDWADDPPADEFARQSDERTGNIELTSGLTFVSHTYATPFPDGSEVIVLVTMSNTSEDLSKPYIGAMITQSNNAGFTAKFSASTPSGNYNLAYRAILIP